MTTVLGGHCFERGTEELELLLRDGRQRRKALAVGGAQLRLRGVARDEDVDVRVARRACLGCKLFQRLKVARVVLHRGGLEALYVFNALCKHVARKVRLPSKRVHPV